MIAFDVGQPQGAGDGVEDVLGDAADVAPFQADVPVGADSGQHGDLLPAQPGDAAAPAGGATRPAPV